LILIVIGIRRTRYDPSLFVAIATGNTVKTEQILNNGSNPNVFDLSGGLSPLHVATLSGLSECVNILLKHGAEVDASDKGSVGGTALYASAEKGYVEIAKLLIEHGANVNGRTKEGKTALMIAAAKGSSELVGLLIDKGADVNASDHAGFTALISAAYNTASDKDAFRVVKILLEHRANTDKSTSEGITPLFGAISGGNLDIVRILIENGADVNKSHPLDGTSPLMFSVMDDKNESAELLIENGADVNARQKHGPTVLMGVIHAGNEELAKILIERGANVKASFDGNTALDYARAQNMTAIFNLLSE